MAGKMRAEDVKVDLNEMNKFKKKNFEDRLKFIEYWIEYIKEHSDKEWSEGQGKFIDAQYSMAKRFEKNYKKYVREKSQSSSKAEIQES